MRFFAVLCLLSVGLPAAAATDYVLDFADSAHGVVQVEVELDCEAPACEVRMPVWNAVYQVRDFARFVSGIAATDSDGRELTVSRTSPSSWGIAVDDAGRVQVRYRVRADRSGPFGSYADSEEVTLNLGQLLVYSYGIEDQAATLRFRNRPEGFREALSLQRSGDAYRAPSYAALIDTPVHLSVFDERAFDLDGKTIRVTAVGRSGTYNMELLVSNAFRLFEAARRLMGELPFESYTIVYVFSDVLGGGMEYSNGTVIFGPADCLSCGMASLTAHEIFHLWNVKRIRPRSMEPPDYSRPQPSPSLWFAEGVTSTYARYLQAMAGMLPPAQFESEVGELINDYLSRPARLTQTAEESGIEAWLERYPDYSRADRSVSYYLRGELIGHLLDLAIRRRTANRRSLDDVLRLLQRRYGRTGVAYDDTDAIEQALVDIGGESMRTEVERLVRRAAPIDWDDYLSAAGYRLERRAVGTIETGLLVSGPPGEPVTVAAVEQGSAAEEVGIRPGDRILRLDGRNPTGGAAEVRRRLERSPGRRIRLELDREGVPSSVELRPRRGKRVEHRLEPTGDATDLQLAIRRGWMERWTTSTAAGPSE